MSRTDDILINRFQENLGTIRRVAGWTAERLGDEIGVTRQTVSNLEKGKTPMTKTQYLACRAVLAYEISNTDNQALAQVIRTLVDEPVEGMEAAESFDGDGSDENLKESKKAKTVLTSGTIAGLSALTAALASGLVSPLAVAVGSSAAIAASKAISSRKDRGEDE